MKLPYILVATLATSLLTGEILGDNEHSNRKESRSSRIVRQTSADQMVQNILQWLQGVYTQQSRRSRFADYETLYNFASDKLDDAFRQGTLREYLPPTNTQKPRPFEPVSPSDGNGIDHNGNYLTGYPPAGLTPQPPFPTYSNPATGYPSPTTYPQPPYTSPSSPPITGYPTGPTGYPTGPTGYPTGPTGYPTGSTGPVSYPTPGYPSQRPEISTPGGFMGYPTAHPGPSATTEPASQPPIDSTGYPPSDNGLPGFPTHPPPTVNTGYPSERPSGSTTEPPSDVTSERPGFPTRPPSGTFTGYPTQPDLPTRPPPGTFTGYPTQPDLQTQTPSGTTTSRPVAPTDSPSPKTDEVTQGQSTPAPATLPPVSPTVAFTSATTSEGSPSAGITTTQSPEINTIPTEKPEKPGDSEPTDSGTDEDLQHPPHIHAIDVECAKDMMTINIEFNREFNGVIYSKGYYNMPECRYVKENSAQTKYSFTVNLNMCGTEFINAFDTQGQSYLENVLVLQNEVGIQEIWDTVRAVRCLWEGNLKESLSVALSVGMLSQEIVTFSGDTAMAKLDIQLGKGPFAQPANGLVKIGESMTLVVSVSGDPGFDIQVKDCRATDSTGDNIVPLTDDDGCVLKPKLFGAFQKTRNTGDTGASIIAYAFFNAFKFPDVMDLMIECNIELCKTDCEMCTDPNQKIDPGRRRRRDLYSFNETLHDGVTMGKHLRIILPEDLHDQGIVDVEKNDGVCMSTQSFVFASSLLISLVTASCLFSAYMWLKFQRHYLTKQ